MRVSVVAVGKPKDPALAAAIREYEQRAARYWPLDTVEVKEESGKSLSRDAVMAREGERLLERVPTGASLVACDAEGQRMTSDAFSAWLQKERESARDVSFVIGGANGLSPSVRKAASRTLSLAPWTLPHELARLVLAEQLYRAGTIVRGEPYNK